jgi:predicted DCC family thiol-disulfide oxidoreductase YuxK
MFHNLTFLLMRIAFITLQTSYVSLFNWHCIFHRMGRWLFRRPMVVAFDGRCIGCLRWMAALRTLDLLGRVEYVNARDRKAMEATGFDAAMSPSVASGLCAVTGGRTRCGFDALRAIAGRMPVLWPILPLLYLWPISAIGARLVGRAASGSSNDADGGRPDSPLAARSIPLRGVMALGIFLLVGNLVFGLMEERRGWPLTCYPPFSHILGPQTHSLRMVAVDASGRPIDWREHDLVEEFSWARYGSMLRLIRQRNDPRQFDAFYRVALRFDPALASAARVQFYDELLWVAPERQKDNPVQRQLFHETLPNPSLASR